MKMGLKVSVDLRHKLRLPTLIDLATLMNLPDQALELVVDSMAKDPSMVESVLRENNEGKVYDSKSEVNSVYSAIAKRAIASGVNIGLTGLEGILNVKEIDTPPDVVYIGVRNSKPEVIFSRNLEEKSSLKLIQVDHKEYPLTNNLLHRIKSHDSWKIRKLRDAYLLIGDHQREFFEGFDFTSLNQYNLNDLASRLDITGSTVCRILTNRLVAAQSSGGRERIFPVKTFFVTEHDILRYAAIPNINKVLVEEFTEGIAYSDKEFVKRSGGIARRTFTKYREDSGIPNSKERTQLYNSGALKVPYRIEL